MLKIGSTRASEKHCENLSENIGENVSEITDESTSPNSSHNSNDIEIVNENSSNLSENDKRKLSNAIARQFQEDLGL